MAFSPTPHHRELGTPYSPCLSREGRARPPAYPWWEASPRLTYGATADRQAVAPEHGAHVQAAAAWEIRVRGPRGGWGSGQGCHGQGGPEDALAGAEQTEDRKEAAPFMLKEQHVSWRGRVVQGSVRR